MNAKNKIDKRLLDKEWRVNHLYKIIDKNAKLVPFRKNKIQTKLDLNKHTRNIILKFRQGGITTYELIDGLDDVLFNRNFNFTLIAHRKDDAEKIFKKAMLAWKHFPLKHLYTVTKETQQDIEFAHGSSITVTVSARSATVSRLHISEFGYICRHFPERAEEIVTGSIPAVVPGGRIDIESTAMGETGRFYEMYTEAENRGEPQAPQEFKAHFFNWTNAPEYTLKGDFDLPKWAREYQKKHKLTDEQINWYFYEWKTQKEKMKSEHPTTSEEAFEGSGNKLFPIEIIKEKIRTEIEEGDKSGEWVFYRSYEPGHSYGLGADVSEGIGSDFNTIIIIDFTKSIVAARYKNNLISPDLFAYEIKNGAEKYGNCIVGVERNNHGHATISKLKEIYSVNKIYKEWKTDIITKKQTEKLGWHTNLATKPRIMNEFKTAIQEDLLIIPDRGLLNEMKVYDIEELNAVKADEDKTNHFDVLMACAIAWEMRKHAQCTVNKNIIQKRQNYAQERRHD